MSASEWNILSTIVTQTRRILCQESTKTLQDDNITLNRIDDYFRNILRSKTIISTILGHNVSQSVTNMICSRLTTKNHDETTVTRDRKVWSLCDDWLEIIPCFSIPRSHFPILRWTTLEDKITLLFHSFWSRSDCFTPECQFLHHPDMMTQRFMRLRSQTRSHLQQISHRVRSTRKSTNIRDTADTWMHWVQTSWTTSWCACIYSKTFARFAARREGRACFLWVGPQSACSSVLFQHSDEHAPYSSHKTLYWGLDHERSFTWKSASLSYKPSDGRDCRVEVLVDKPTSYSVSLDCVYPPEDIAHSCSKFVHLRRTDRPHKPILLSDTYYSPSKTRQYLERDDPAGSSHQTRCPLGQLRNTRRPKRTFSKQTHVGQLALTAPSQRLRTGPPPACHPLDEPTQEWVRPLSHHRWIKSQSRSKSKKKRSCRRERRTPKRMTSRRRPSVPGAVALRWWNDS